MQPLLHDSACTGLACVGACPAQYGAALPHTLPPPLPPPQVGYVITGMKNVKAARVGDTWHAAKRPVEPLPGFRPAKSMVFAGVYPASREDFESLASAIDKLTLNDASVSARRESSDALGAGFR
jgi:translation elongation factor EF-4